MELFRLLGTIAINGMDSVESDIDNITKRASSLSETIANKFESFGKSVSSVGAKMSLGLTAPLTLIGKSAISATANFESAMSEVAAISGATGDDFIALQKKAEEMGKSTKFSATESAEALKYMAMAGWKTSDMLDGLEGIMSLAAASGEDLGMTSDIVTDALTAFGMAASDSAHFSDILATASSNSNTNVGMMGETFKYVAPVAGALGYSAEDTALAIGLMANSGIKASQAGTSLRGMLTRLAKPTKESSIVMEELDLSIVNTDGSMKSLSEVMIDMRNGFSNLTEAEKAEYASMLAGQEAMSGLLAIVNASDEDFNKLAHAIDNCEGSAKQMADTMNDNLSGQITLLKSQLEGLAIQFVTLIMPYIKQFVEWLSKVCDWISNLDDGTKKLIIAVGAFLAAAGPVLIFIGKVSTGIGAIIKVGGSVITLVTKTASGITGLIGIGGKLIGGIVSIGGKITSMLIPALASIGPVGWAIIAAIGALIAIGVALYKNWDEVSAWASSAWSSIKEVVCNAIDAIADFLGKIVDFVKDNWQGLLLMLVNPFVGGFKLIYDNCESFRNSINEFIQNIIDFLSNAGESIKNFFEGLVDNIKAIWDKLKEITIAAFEAIKDAIATVWNTIKEVVSTALEAVKNIVVTAWETIKTAVANALEAIKSVVTSAWEAIKTAISTALEMIKAVILAAWETIKTAISTALEAIKTVITTAWETIKTAILSAMEAIKSAVTTAWEAIKSAISTALEAIKAVVVAAWEAIKSVVSTAMEAIKSVISTAWEGIKTSVSNAINFVKDTISNGINAAKDIISSVLDGIRDKFTSIFDSAKEIVSNAIETIKGFFDFEWKLPEIKLPHFSISGNFSLNPPSIPSFGIEWYKDGGIMNDPTMFGFNPFSNKAMVGGEAGPEAIAPISTLQSYVRDAVSETNNKLYTVMNAVLSVLTQYLPELAHMQVVMDTGETVGVLATPMSEKLGKMTYMRERTN